MLVLNRKVNEQIQIGPIDDDGVGSRIKITVVEIKGNTVRLGIEAPPEVPVHRKEVGDAIRRHEAMMKKKAERAERVKVKGEATKEEGTDAS